jgi:hypothetical protein
MIPKFHESGIVTFGRQHYFYPISKSSFRTPLDASRIVIRKIGYTFTNKNIL